MLLQQLSNEQLSNEQLSPIGFPSGCPYVSRTRHEQGREVQRSEAGLNRPTYSTGSGDQPIDQVCDGFNAQQFFHLEFEVERLLEIVD